MRRVLIAGLAALFVPGVLAGHAASAPKDDDDSKDETSDDAPKKSKKADPDEDQPKAGEGEAVAVGKPAARMTMPGGRVLLDAIVEANLGKSAVGKPFSVAPDIWYGASNKLTLGLVHSGRGLTGFLTGAGRGLCFGDKDGACSLGLGKIYTSVGGEARIGLTEGGFPIALTLGSVVQAFKPKVVASSKVGLLARAQSKSVALELAPTVFAGLTQRKVGGMGFNEDVLSLPVTLFLNLSPAFAIALQSGVSLTLEHAADTYVVPAAIGLAWWVSPKFSFDLAFGLTAVVDKNDMTKAFDGRSLSLGVGYGM
jgi:hypothetical protein